MKPIFPNLFNNNNSKSYRPKKKQIYNMNNISNPFFNNSQIKLQKNSKIKKR